MPALGDAPITAAVLGQGSIGRRHARLLLAEGCDVVAWDPAPAESVDAVRMVGTPDEALSAADVAVVASPSVRHLEQLAMALDHGCHVLVEKPAATSAAGIADLQTAATDADLVVAVAMNLRFHPGPSTVRELIAGGAIGRPLTAHVAFGSFLPSWRPGTDYRTGYSARAELGGGVLLDAIHELDYLTWVLGPAGDVDARLAHVSDLEVDVEDTATMTIRHESDAISVVTLDYLDQSYHRGCRIVGSEATVEWSWSRESVSVLGASEVAREIPAPSAVDGSYAEQMSAFLHSAREGSLRPPLCGLDEALGVMALADAARVAAATGRRTPV